MASNNYARSTQVRRDIESEREQLAGAAESLREEISEATNIRRKLRANLPAVAVGALGVGFLLAGGSRRNREADLPARTGRRDEGQARPLSHCRPRLTWKRDRRPRAESPEKLSRSEWIASFKRSLLHSS